MPVLANEAKQLQAYNCSCSSYDLNVCVFYYALSENNVFSSIKTHSDLGWTDVFAIGNSVIKIPITLTHPIYANQINYLIVGSETQTSFELYFLNCYWFLFRCMPDGLMIDTNIFHIWHQILLDIYFFWVNCGHGSYFQVYNTFSQ